MRAFVAIELDEACREGLRKALEALRPAARGVRWVKPEALHLTLKFIGPLDETDLPRAIECLRPASAEAGPFVMNVSGLSGFPGRGAPRVIHVEVQEPTGTLVALQGRIDAALKEALGIPKEKREYVSHITLGRVKDRRACPSMAEVSAAVAEQRFGAVSVDSMVLMKSDLRPDGAVYTVVHRFPLGG